MLKKSKSNPLSLVMAIVMLVSFLFVGQIPTSAIEINNGSFDVVSAKKSLVEKYKDNYKEGFEETEAGKKHSEEVQKLLCEVQSGLTNEAEANTVLENMGVYKLELSYDNEAVSRSANSNYVTINKPSIYYDSNDSLWYVTGGGYWKSDSYWMNDLYFSLPSTVYNIGAQDGIGVEFYSTSGTAASVRNRYAYYSDGQGNTAYSYNPVSGDSSKGSFFKYQDTIYVEPYDYVHGETLYNYRYMGKHFAAMIIYGSEFANYNGIASTCYAHTCKDGLIASVTFGTSGIDITLNSTAKGFTVNSPSETVF